MPPWGSCVETRAGRALPWGVCPGGIWPEGWSAGDTPIHSPGRMVENREVHDTMRGSSCAKKDRGTLDP